MKPQIELIVGKTIGAVVVADRDDQIESAQVFLVFDDATTYEFYGRLVGSSGLDVGGTKWAVQYAEKLQADKITVYGDEEIGSELTGWSRIRHRE